MLTTTDLISMDETSENSLYPYYNQGEEIKKPIQQEEIDAEKEEAEEVRSESLRWNCNLGFLVTTLVVSIAHLCLLAFVTTMLMQHGAQRYICQYHLVQ